MVPNVIGPVIVYATLTVPQIILFESFLSFLGLGIQEPRASLGTLIAEGAGEMEAAPWMLLAPGVFLAVLLVSLNIFGDGLRDAFDVQGAPMSSAITPTATLRLESLRVSYARAGGTIEAVREVSLAVRAGECLGIVGESGSGKTQVFMAAMGLLAPNARTERQRALRGRGNPGPRARRAEPRARLEAHHDLPGSDDLAHAAPQDRRAARRGPGEPPRHVLGAKRSARRCARSSACGCPSPSGGCSSIRMSCRAACASA